MRDNGLLIALVFAGALCGSLGIAAIAVLTSAPYATIVIPLCTLISVCFPRAALLTFLFALPIFGNRPGSTQAYVLLIISAGLTIGMVARMIASRNSISSAHGGNHSARAPLALELLLLYCLISLASLSGMPWNQILPTFVKQVPALSDLSALSYALRSILKAREEQWQYIVVSVYWTLSSAVLTLAILHWGNRFYYLNQRSFSLQCAWALFAGFFFSVLVGILDYYSVIDLRHLRALDPVVNPGDKQFRLQSFFGHSGWFAEFVTLSAPIVLLLLLLRRTFATRVSLIIISLLLGEFVLILTFQRGGWLSYPLTLLVVWSAIYITRKIECGESSFSSAFRSSVLKILISLPLTVIVSLLIITGLTRTGLLSTDASVSIHKYAQRFSDIQKASDRTEFMWAGWKLGLLQPLLGNGSESFAFMYQREFANPDGHYFQEVNLPLHGSAHNVYLQTFAGKGALGLLALLACIVCLIGSALRTVFTERQQSSESRVLLLVSASALVAFLIYGHVQEIFYIQSLQFLFFAVFGIGLSHLPVGVSFSSRARFASWGLIGLAAIFQILGNSQDKPALTSYGCFSEERDAAGNSYRWCGPHALLTLAAPQDGTSALQLRFQMGKSLYPANQVSMQIRVRGETYLFAREISVSSGGTYSIDIPLQGKVPLGQTVSVFFDTASYFIPARDMSLSKDSRILSFRLLGYEFVSGGTSSAN